MIKFINGIPHYFDKNGAEITEGCRIRYPNGKVERVYQTQDGELGIDATNPRWIATGRAIPCEMGVYPLTNKECSEVEVLK